MGPDWNFPDDDETSHGPNEDRSLHRHGDEDRPSFWTGPVAVVLRLACVGGALVSVTIAVLASVGNRPDPVAPPILEAAVRIAPAPAAVPASAVFAPILPPGTRKGDVVLGPVFQRRLTASPADLCRSLKVGERSSGWAPSAVYGSEYECISTLKVRDVELAPVPAPEGKAASAMAQTAPRTSYAIFAMARGTNEDDVRYVRFKISASDMAGADAASTVLADRLKQLYAAIGWPLPELADYATRLRQPFSMEEQGTTIRLVKERMNEWSYNLILEFPKPPRKIVAEAAAPEPAVTPKPVARPK